MGSLLPGWDENAQGVAPKGARNVLLARLHVRATPQLLRRCQRVGSARLVTAVCTDERHLSLPVQQVILRMLAATEFQDFKDEEEDLGYFATYNKLKK